MVKVCSRCLSKFRKFYGFSTFFTHSVLTIIFKILRKKSLGIRIKIAKISSTDISSIAGKLIK